MTKSLFGLEFQRDKSPSCREAWEEAESLHRKQRDRNYKWDGAVLSAHPVVYFVLQDCTS